jgi:hypothetical protein
VKSSLAASNPSRLSLPALRKRSNDVALEVLTDGIDLPDHTPRRAPTVRELRERAIALGVPPPNHPARTGAQRDRTEFMHLLSAASGTITATCPEQEGRGEGRPGYRANDPDRLAAPLIEGARAYAESSCGG